MVSDKGDKGKHLSFEDQDQRSNCSTRLHGGHAKSHSVVNDTIYLTQTWLMTCLISLKPVAYIKGDAAHNRQYLFVGRDLRERVQQALPSRTTMPFAIGGLVPRPTDLITLENDMAKGLEFVKREGLTSKRHVARPLQHQHLIGQSQHRVRVLVTGIMH